MRRTLLAVFTLAAVASAGVWLGCGRPPRPAPRLQSENYPQVRVGLSQAEVEELLGGPPGNYGRQTGVISVSLEYYGGPPGSVVVFWHDDSTRFEIFFDAQNRVAAHHKRALYRQNPSESLVTVWRRRLGI